MVDNVKDSPHEIGFVIGALVGFLWMMYLNVRTIRSGGGAIWIFMMICGGIGAGIGWLIGSLF